MTPIFTRLLDGREYGIYSYYMSWLGVLSILTSTVTSGSIIYKGLGENRENESSYLMSAIMAGSVISLTFCALLFAFNVTFEISPRFILLMLLQSIADGIIAIYLLGCKYHYFYRAASITGILEGVLAVLIAIILIYRHGFDYMGRILGMLIAAALFATPAFMHLMHNARQKTARRSFVGILKGSISLIPHAISSATINQAEKLLLANLLGAIVLAKYSVAHSLGATVGFLTSALSSALHPWATRKLTAKRAMEISSAVSFIIPLLGGAILIIVGFAPEAMRLLAPIEYRDAAYAILPIAISALPTFISGLATVGLVHRGFSKLTARSGMIAAIFNVLLCLILIPRFSYVGAGVALLISHVTMAVCNLFALKAADISEMLPIKNLPVTFLKYLLFGIGEVLLYPYPALRILMMIYPALTIIGAALRTRELIFDK